MNEKIRRHIDVIFAAAPKTAKAAELKEELLHNLNDKYEDLLQSGYDSTAAFHIALSGIGDIDELFQACVDDATFSRESISFEEHASVNAKNTKLSAGMTTFLIVLAFVLFLLPILAIIVSANTGTAISAGSLLLCWIGAIALLVYLIVKFVQNTSNSYNPTAPQPAYDSYEQSEISSKRITAGVLALLLGVFGVHKFYLGMTGTGVIVLLSVFLTAFLMAPVASIIGLIEGIIYLTKSDREFYRDYIVQKRAWF